MASSLFNLPFVRVCLLGVDYDGSPLHALKGNYRLTELLFKKHVLPEAETISLHEAAKNGDIRGLYLVLNLTTTSVDTMDQYVRACWGLPVPMVLGVGKDRTPLGCSQGSARGCTDFGERRCRC